MTTKKPINYRTRTPLEIEAEKNAWAGSARAMGEVFDRQFEQFERHVTRPISLIIVGERHRKDFGDIDALAKSIAEIGLLHPMVITSNNELIAGARRLAACKQLGWKKVPVTVVNIDACVRGEYAENTLRKDFTPSEMVAIAATFDGHERAMAKLRMTLGKISTGSKTGKTRDLLAASFGISGRTLEKAKAVVQAAEAEPEKFAKLVEAMDDSGHVEAPYQELKATKSEMTEAAPASDAPTIMLKTHLGADVPYKLPKGKPTFNKTNQQVDWAKWTWNPVTGCLHGCKYCYAREMAEMRASYRTSYPVGFTPLFHHERLDAPANTPVPDGVDADPRLKRVFVCSMADLYGKWVPDEWIEKVHASCIANPQWDYLMLTKFPRRYVGLELPSTAWLGTSVDEQKRVRLAEEAFRQIKDVRVKWLSLEPLLAPLEFSDLSMFDWIVIGAQSATDQPEGRCKEFSPPFEWVARIVAQAREAGCRVYLKPNLLGAPNSQSPGMQLPQEEPVERARHDAEIEAAI